VWLGLGDKQAHLGNRNALGWVGLGKTNLLVSLPFHSWEVEGRFKREGTYVYLWLIYVNVWQKPIQYCKAIILQLKINLKNDYYRVIVWMKTE